MKKQIIWFLTIFTLTALVSSARRVKKSEPPQLPVVHALIKEEPPAGVDVPLYTSDWEPGGFLSEGDVMYSTKRAGFALAQELNPGDVLPTDKTLELTGSTLQLQVNIGIADHRWTRYGPLEATVVNGKIILECQVMHYTQDHIEDYRPSPASTNVVTLTDLNGRYEVFLSERLVGSVSFNKP